MGNTQPTVVVAVKVTGRVSKLRPKINPYPPKKNKNRFRDCGLRANKKGTCQATKISNHALPANQANNAVTPSSAGRVNRRHRGLLVTKM